MVIFVNITVGKRTVGSGLGVGIRDNVEIIRYRYRVFGVRVIKEGSGMIARFER